MGEVTLVALAYKRGFRQCADPQCDVIDSRDFLGTDEQIAAEVAQWDSSGAGWVDGFCPGTLAEMYNS